MQKKTTKI